MVKVLKMNSMGYLMSFLNCVFLRITLPGKSFFSDEMFLMMKNRMSIESVKQSKRHNLIPDISNDPIMNYSF